MTDQNELPDYSKLSDSKPTRRVSMRAGLIAAALLAVGVGGGATVAHMAAPSVEMAPASPVAIRSLSDGEGGGDSIVTVRGKVAEVYGPAFILADGSGRALVEAGRHHGFMSGDSTLVAVGQTVTVQGHFRDGTIHASFLVGADGKVTALRPLGPPRGGPDGPGGRHGPHGGPEGPEGRDPDRGPDGADAPPPAATAPVAAPAVTANSAG